MSLWQALMGNDDDDDESVRDNDDCEDDEVSGVRVLARHVANVKLAAEERDFRYVQQLSEADKTIASLRQMLKEAGDKASAMEEHVKALELQNTKKWQIESRDHWVKMVEELKAERARLREENARLVEEIRKLGSREGGDAARATAQLEDARAAFAEKEAGWQAQLAQAARDAEAKEVVIAALRKKLDFGTRA